MESASRLKVCEECKKRFICTRYGRQWEETKFCSRECFGRSQIGILKKELASYNCDWCDKTFCYRRSDKRKEKKFCSASCSGKYGNSQAVKANNDKGLRWNGGKTVHQGYIMLWMPDHPAARQSGYVMEHRLVCEKRLGRLLYPNEVVHHINGIKDDNREENLVVLTSRAEHNHLHRGKQ
jgi:hypothetical protein